MTIIHDCFPFNEAGLSFKAAAIPSLVSQALRLALISVTPSEDRPSANDPTNAVQGSVLSLGQLRDLLQGRMADNEPAYFKNIQWCAALFSNPDYVSIPMPSRSFKQSTEDALVAETLKTRTTIPAMSMLYKKPPAGQTLITQACILVALEHGINGYPGVAHGGFLGVLIDEAMGQLFTVNKDAKDEMGQGPGSDSLVTASLKIDYKKAVLTPQVIMVTAAMGEIKSPKIWQTATITDGNGALLAKAEALWIWTKVRRPRKL